MSVKQKWFMEEKRNMVRRTKEDIEDEEDEDIDDREIPDEEPSEDKKSKNKKMTIVEREINLQLINDKINVILNLLQKEKSN